MTRSALVLAMLFAGCATVDVYHYQAKPLPAGSEALAVLNWSLQDLKNVSWNSNHFDANPMRRARVGADARGVAAVTDSPRIEGPVLYLSYAEIANDVAWVTQTHGTWTVLLRDGQQREVELQFGSFHAARLFLDAASELAQPAAAPTPVAFLH